jgi:hypothetical protein
MLMEKFLRSKEYWTVVVSEVVELAEGIVKTDAQNAEFEGLKLKDLKAKNYFFQAIDAQSWKLFFARTPPSIFGIP